MFFRGIDSKLLRAAYVGLVLSFISVPVHYLSKPKGGRIFLAINTAILGFCLVAAIFGKPSDRSQRFALIFYALLAWIVHFVI